MFQFAARIRHEKQLLGRGRLTVPEIARMIESPPGPDSELLLLPEEGDFASALESARDVAPIIVARAVIALPRPAGGKPREVLAGAFEFDADDVAYVAEHPGAGRFAVAADAALVRALEEAERRAEMARRPAPPPEPAAPVSPPGSDGATGVVSAPMVV